MYRQIRESRICMVQFSIFFGIFVIKFDLSVFSNISKNFGIVSTFTAVLKVYLLVLIPP